MENAMTRLTLDAATTAKLTEQAAIFDESGRMVGLFLTPEAAFRFVCMEAQHDFDHTTTEQCRREVAEQGTVSAEEVRKMFAENRRRSEARK
jgi:hypothetical protein